MPQVSKSWIPPNHETVLISTGVASGISWRQGFTPNTFRQEDAELTANQRLRRFLQAQVGGGFSKGVDENHLDYPPGELTYPPWERVPP